MQIHNNTEYRTSDLRKIFTACCKMADVKVVAKRLSVTVDCSRTIITGESFIGANVVWMHIPKNVTPKECKKLVRLLVWTFIHELYHCGGYDHYSMRNMVWAQKYIQKHPEADCVSWADKFELRKKISKEEYYKERFDHAGKMVERHIARSEKEKKLIANWKRKFRYYERRVEKSE